METYYNEIILTPTGRIKKTCPRDRDNMINLSAMGEIGERCVAQTLRNIARGVAKDQLPFSLGPDDIPVTTQQLVEQKVMTPDVEKEVQLAGVDIVILTSEQWKDLTFKVTMSWVKNNADRCIQVKLQPFAPNYGSITVETCQDNRYKKSCSLKEDLVKGRFSASGINKTLAHWTAYIVSGGTFIIINTDELRNIINGKERKHIGTSWGWSKDYPFAKRAVGTTANLLSLLQSQVSYAVGIDPVFRSYLSSLTNVEDEPSNYKEHSYQQFLQDWSPETLMKFLGGGITALPDCEVKGGQFIW